MYNHHVEKAFQTIDSLTSWWRHQMDTFSALLALCAGNSPVTCEFPAQRPVTRSCDVFFDLRLNQQLSKQWRRRWFETPSCSLWRHCNLMMNFRQLPVTCLTLFAVKPSTAQHHRTRGSVPRNFGISSCWAKTNTEQPDNAPSLPHYRSCSLNTVVTIYATIQYNTILYRAFLMWKIGQILFCFTYHYLQMIRHIAYSKAWYGYFRM